MEGDWLKYSVGKKGTQQSNASLTVVLEGSIIGRRMGGAGSTSTVENGKGGRRETPQSTVGFVGVL
jgi:hypothetical protein